MDTKIIDLQKKKKLLPRITQRLEIEDQVDDVSVYLSNTRYLIFPQMQHLRLERRDGSGNRRFPAIRIHRTEDSSERKNRTDI